ncbi:4Fe-4S ferredoxin, iron-sulfur binding domain protein [Pyrobaculum islandicum DSM 4184]|uniref:4Fe-4S ferredoxin, iron-sulfur binding domain protein n=1 Tax=Pyrobaculum islandicum (strain DSM 4184 / JCM 9189 / GEO3) TaxID=384616 RepID=A1RV02_PYRIL|nr:NADH-quinone oxidoreductase subunit NuoI [Pyrobaculum islandicum]ABL88784.1 4Fe-4S ferredoxin, iron-sulfur binding domain protein [Pyrobaculum islandicum DSM 4184]
MSSGKLSYSAIIKATIDAISIAARNFVKPERITIYYPYEKLEYGRARGWIGLLVEKCTSCMMCARICPANAIKMYVAPNGKRYPGIDYGRCIMCHFCIDVCPTEALFPTDIKELTWYDSKEMLYTPEMEREPPKIHQLHKPIKVAIKYAGGIPKKVKLA